MDKSSLPGEWWACLVAETLGCVCTSMNEAKVGAVLGGIGIVLFFFGWALDRSELMGRPLREGPRSLVSTIATWAGAGMVLAGLIIKQP